MVVATSDRIQGRSGGREVHTELRRVIFWGKLAEITEKHLAKGRLVYIEGRMQLRSWQDRNGNDRFNTEIVGERLQLLSGSGVAAPVWPNEGRSDATGDVCLA
jgi:single-strand DNA-binding protein